MKRKILLPLLIMFILIFSGAISTSSATASGNTVCWDTPQIVDRSGINVAITNLVLDSNYQPHIAYMDNTYFDAEYTYFDPVLNDWVYHTLDSDGRTGHHPVTAIDSQDRVHVAFRNLNTRQPSYVMIDGATITLPELIDGRVSPKPMAIAVDSQDNPHIAYWTDGQDNIVHAWFDGTSWQKETVKHTRHSAVAVSIAIDSNDTPQIAYQYDFDQSLYLAIKNGTTWQHEKINESTPSGGRISFVLDSLNNPHVAIADRLNNVLKYFWKDNNGDWHKDELGPAIYTYSNIVVDSSNNPHIVYSDLEDSNLVVKYIYKDSSGWVGPESVDFGYNPWIALDENDNPHISYTNGDWHLAYIVGEDCFQPPIVDAGGPYDGGEGSVVPLDEATVTSASPFRLEWSVSSPLGICSFDDDTILHPNITCADNGDFDLELRAYYGPDTDDYVPDYSSVVITNVPPTADFTMVPDVILITQSSVATFSNQLDLSSVDTAAGFTYEYDCDGDGVDFEFTSTSPTQVCPPFYVPGIHTVYGRIIDKDGGVLLEPYRADVLVQTPADRIGDIQTEIATYDLPNAKLNNVQNAIDKLSDDNLINDNAVIGSLEALINQVESQAGKKLTQEEADYLIGLINEVLAVLNQ